MVSVDNYLRTCLKKSPPFPPPLPPLTSLPSQVETDYGVEWRKILRGKGNKKNTLDKGGDSTEDWFDSGYTEVDRILSSDEGSMDFKVFEKQRQINAGTRPQPPTAEEDPNYWDSEDNVLYIVKWKVSKQVTAQACAGRPRTNSVC